MKEIIVKINKTKIWSFDKIFLKNDNFADSSRKKKGWLKSINEKGGHMTDNAEIQRDYWKQLYASKMNRLKEMDKILEKYNFSKLNQEVIENINR